MKRLIDGIEFTGKVKDSGYKNPLYLIRTSDGKFIQLTKLLNNTALALRDSKDWNTAAEKVTELERREIDAEAVMFLAEKKLSPLGILTDTNIIFEAVKPEIKAPDLLFSLRRRFTLIPDKTANQIADLFKILFFPAFILIVLEYTITMNIWLYRYNDLTAALRQTLYQPYVFVIFFSLMIFHGLFHEIGHAAACKYGGGRPGKIGMGLYIAWPAFYTDLTDAYRLNRIAKLRADIGGLYFSLIFSLAIAAAYFLTHFQPLLIFIALQNIAILEQLIPFVRLDGYFMISDLIGIPDLFFHIKPILKSVLLRQPQPATKNLKTWTRTIVTLWVFITVPVLLFYLLMLLIHIPQIFTSTWNSASLQIQNISINTAKHQFLLTAISIFQLIFLLIPILGVTYILFRYCRMLYFRVYNLISRIIPQPAKSKPPLPSLSQ